ncbi:MAG TPA: TetR/AcrR family transcriptional regulator [Mariniphaga sp.]|nr:TetR/AcrR family transcriptional regulator [Mariniphaga sp.]
MTKQNNDNKGGKPTSNRRKNPSDLIRDKTRTYNKLIDAVGQVLKEKGYHGLTPPNIAKATGSDKRLVWTYFGGMDSLIETFFAQRDYWKGSSRDFIADLLKHPDQIKQDDISALLNNQFDTVLNDVVLQKLIHWELGENKSLLRKIADEREEIGEKLFNAIEPDFENSGVDLRAILAVAIGGIYYLSLHAKTNGSTFCGIDINEEEGKKRIENVIRYMVDTFYEKAKV